MLMDDDLIKKKAMCLKKIKESFREKLVKMDLDLKMW
jgi:hypothetical protein